MSRAGAKADRRRAEAAGRRAETLVAWWLRLTGHTVLARRFRCREGEIDLIAARWGVVRFIEVKQRSQAAHAAEPVTARSERRILAASDVWMARNPIVIGSARSVRYDIVTVTGRWRISTLPDAFRGW